MAAKVALLVSSVAFSLAQQSVLSLPFYGYDDQTIVASVVGADSTATTLALDCYYPPNYQDSDEDVDCGLFPSQTLIYGPSTYHMDKESPGEAGFTGTQDCISTSICMESAGGEGANFPGSSTATYEAEDIDTMGVTVTAGLEKLSGASTRTAPASAEASATGSSAAGATESSSSVERTTLTGGAGQTSTGTASGSAAEQTSGTSTEAGAAATGVGMGGGLGVAAAVVGVLGVLL